MTIEVKSTDLTYNERVGIQIKTWLVRKRLRQSDLSSALSLSQGAVSQRLIGNQSFSMNDLIIASGLFEVTLGELLGPELLNEKGPSPAVRDEGLEECSPPDSNRQPTDYLLGNYRGFMVADKFLIALIFLVRMKMGYKDFSYRVRDLGYVEYKTDEMD